jgi:hypothetical protein
MKYPPSAKQALALSGSGHFYLPGFLWMIMSAASRKPHFKFDKKAFQHHYIGRKLIAAQLQHLIKKPRDGIQPPKVTLYKPR